MKRQSVLSAVAFLLALCVGTKNGGADERAHKMPVSDRRLPSLTVEQFGVYNAAAEISEKARIAIGVASIQPDHEPTIKLNFPGGTVAALLNQLVSQAPDYEWRETNKGIIHLSRSTARVSLLDTVMSYPGAVNKTRKEIWEDLRQRPEILAWLQSNTCTRSEFFTGHEFNDHNSPISIASGMLTVEQLMDDVALKSGTNYWAILQSRSGNSCKVDIILW